MIIDMHGHLGSINLAPFWQADAPTLERYAVEAGVDCLCVSSSRALMYDVAEGNRELDAALRRTTRLFGYVVASPNLQPGMEDLALAEDNPKFRGVKLHPDYHGYRLDAPSNRRFADRVAARTKLLLFHVSCMPGTGFSPAATVAAIAREHPEVNVILAHMGGVFQNGNYPYYPNLDTIEEIAAAGMPDNLYFDTAHYLMYVYSGVMARMVELAGARHIVFGTDVPLQGPMQMRFARETVEALAIAPEEKELILSGNARRLLRLD